MEPSKATEETLGGSRTAFWRPKGHGVCGRCGRCGRDDEMCGATGSLRLRILTEVLPGFHTPCTPVKQGAADSCILTLRASRRPF